mmetsp:Transcript_37507/g.95247  ORF Transcript_37507/g.95247 Transcript_37507/m.95247 type:complete len:371 (-) Transcript_37507:27-1139(-)
MHCSSPRARAGLRMLAASIAPSAAPAPTRVCSSSMKRMVSLLDVTSSTTFFSRSSNSPRYLVSATSMPSSSEMSRLFLRRCGTLSSAIICASPSAIAVLPTPGSPMRIGLFLVRRESTVIARRTSSSRPITGSSRPARASAVRSRAYLSSASYVASALRDVTRRLPRTWSRAVRRLAVSSGASRSSFLPHRLSSSSARSTCSGARYSSVSVFRCASDLRSKKARESPSEGGSSSWAPRCCGLAAAYASKPASSAFGSTPAFATTRLAIVRSSRNREIARCSDSARFWPRRLHTPMMPWIPSNPASVHLSATSSASAASSAMRTVAAALTTAGRASTGRWAGGGARRSASRAAAACSWSSSSTSPADRMLE